MIEQGKRWLHGRRGRKSTLIHPPWKVGHYVSYFSGREDESWLALYLMIVMEAPDGRLLLRADFKIPNAEGAVYFTLNPDPEIAAPAFIVPCSSELRRGSLDPPFKSPVRYAPTVINLFWYGRAQSAQDALGSTPLTVDYPCGISQVYPVISPISSDGENPRMKHAHLHPSVMITGVARLSFPADENPMTVTSFGRWDPPPDHAHTDPPSHYDYVDLSHPTEAEHDGFALIYPATWFLRPMEREETAATANTVRVVLGGCSCTALLQVTLDQGSATVIEKARERIIGEISTQQETQPELSPKRLEQPALGPNAVCFASEYRSPGLDGILYRSVHGSSSGERLAEIHLFGGIQESHPLHRETLENMNTVFPRILESFRFL